jgi:phosphoribosylglycinamide formyltransferase 1
VNSRLRLGVLGSGKGSNFRAIMENILDGRLAAECRIAISDVENAGILGFARDYQVPSLYMNPGNYRTKLAPEVEEDIVRLLQAENVDLVVLAGFMRVVKKPLLQAFPRRMINIHPSLLPKYPGLEAWKQALEAGESVTGCTVHFVSEQVDAGEIIARQEVQILENDSPESLHARIQEAEHQLLPSVIASLGEGFRIGRNP